MGGIEKLSEGSNYEDKKSPARFRSLTRYSRLIFLLSAMAGLLLAVYQIMGLHSLTGLAVLENSYLYLLLALFLSNVFLVFPATAKSPRSYIPLYDIFLFLICLSVGGYFSVT